MVIRRDGIKKLNAQMMKAARETKEHQALTNEQWEELGK